ncbi:DNA polymerase III subunit alpha [Vulgatibacter incomptus]|uniref:DNA-directed DNA polymerase n=1 Tax=Vulgatibacter incomptus TaxID=1391653 RepID=A0A0K1PIA4_9BACT|nr:error-prone DNA polymerase [Vulgatibacter incomptus]AKU93268.1 DNA polymerase III alpha subunit [Vulgatibacter incomptus]
MAPRYVELRARSAFSFLRGASQPEDLASRAAELGYPAMACGDHGGLYGAPRFHAAAKEAGLRPIVAADVDVSGVGSLRLLVEDAAGYRNLCRLLTTSHATSVKGTHLVSLGDVAEHAGGLVALLGACRDAKAAELVVRTLGAERTASEVQRHLDPADERRNRAMIDLAERHGLPLVATGDVRHATVRERRVMDVLTCIREGVPLHMAGTLLAHNADRHLHPPEEVERRFADLPHAIDGAVALAERCAFTMDSLPYEFPDYPVEAGETQQSLLVQLTFEGARRRYGQRLEGRVRAQLEHELALIGKLKLAGYFLIVWDLVRFCRENGILTQGRGSAANSAVCYSLGITAVDPVGMGLLFERFLSEERGEWPDIDLDLPSGDRREKVIQYVYERYGRSGAAMCAEVITYRGRSAVREVGKVLALSADQIDRMARHISHFEYVEKDDDPGARIAQAGLRPDDERLRLLVELCGELRSLPRHLSQHSGGMIIAKGRLDEIVPLEPAAMADRTVLQWDKDDVEAMKLIKIDLLGLGMMAALEDAVAILESRGTPCDLSQLPADDPAVYDAACAADTVGVFQIESRAQMATLPRMQPRRFYDLVVEVGLIRPGPIVGKMVNPYLARRAGRQAVVYPHPSLEPVLERTLGVPLFQEQLMRVAMVAADFTGGEAQELRRAMSHKRSTERMQRFVDRLRDGMDRKGFSPQARDEVILGIRSFAEYGFPESHAASFALLVYASLWIKVHHPAVFLAALLNNQPMGFYAPASLVKDAQRHGVHVRTPCVVESEPNAKVTGDREVRLGLRSVIGLGEAAAQRIADARRERPFRDVTDVCLRARLDARRAETLAEAGAFAALGATRRQALWEVRSALAAGGPLAPPPRAEGSPLPELSSLQRTLADYASTGLTVGPHLVSRMRGELDALGVTPAGSVLSCRNGSWLRIAGQVIVRQRPGTAHGVVFVTVEDETGFANAVIDPETFQANRTLLLTSPLLLVEGPLQNLEGVATVRGRAFRTLHGPSEDLPASRDFH